jgi:hypothetical protein
MLPGAGVRSGGSVGAEESLVLGEGDGKTYRDDFYGQRRRIQPSRRLRAKASGKSHAAAGVVQRNGRPRHGRDRALAAGGGGFEFSVDEISLR